MDSANHRSNHSEPSYRLHRSGSTQSRRAASIEAALNSQEDEQQTSLNTLGRLYVKVLHFSIITRYALYVAPFALILAVPVILSQTKVIRASVAGADQRGFWIWIELVWLSLWASKLAAHFLPTAVELFAGVVSPGVRHYTLLLSAVEQPVSFVLWMTVVQVTFPVLVRPVAARQTSQPRWISNVKSVLLALLICTCFLLAERTFIQLVSISYRRKQFRHKMKDLKRRIHLLSLLYDASMARFPDHCVEFVELDRAIQPHPLHDAFPTRWSPSGIPMRLVHRAGRFSSRLTTAFGAVAQEAIGQKMHDPASASSVVLRAMMDPRSAEALAERIWASLVATGSSSLCQDDLAKALGSDRQAEAEELFVALDLNESRGLSSAELTSAVAEWGAQYISINDSIHDVGQAIKALDSLLFATALIVCCLVLVAFLSPSFVGTLAASATALLSLSFAFATTCQEVLGSCIFLFIKHPYDTGDRVEIANQQLVVDRISLLYTVFQHVESGEATQAPHIVLNNLWIGNISRSRVMGEQMRISLAFDTSFEDIDVLKGEMTKFLREPNSHRYFCPDLAVDVIGIAETDKLELRVQIQYKGNFSDEAMRLSQRCRFMRALVSALRSIPLHGPGGGDAVLGSAERPTWSVSVSPAEARAAREKLLGSCGPTSR
ncbi:hypothetical protein DM02DRAFT_664237 [Periconia macrospinosa]|uniref:Mechanosensitive ion channel protein Msy1/2-like transmembrane domain-containing protein n=1 Tax=Periconia macrospinosa TaxID=97972 RepID=A0A2V1D1S5_9PLEO|nr:hypothetical protein DM02DRAFT_664237 [Periconia macrospinosa]